MTHQETCLCKKRTLDFSSQFESDTVAALFCPDCVERAPSDALVFELCEPGQFMGLWGVRYNRGELKRLDPWYRDSDDYYLSLLISGTCGPKVAREYKTGGLCRIFGFKKLPEQGEPETELPGTGYLEPQAKTAASRKKPRTKMKKK